MLKALSVILAILLIACSGGGSGGSGLPDNNEDDCDKGNVIIIPPDNGNDNGGNNETDSIITNLPELPEAIGGILNKEMFENMPNRIVNEGNLQEFLSTFRTATRGTSAQNIRNLRGKRTARTAPRSDSGDLVFNFEGGGFRFPGIYGGHMVWEWTYQWAERETAEFYEIIEKGTETYKISNFSDAGSLFVGHVIILAFYEYFRMDKNGWREVIEGKVNGNIAFRGEFSGSIEYNFPYYKIELSSKTAASSIFRGDIFINSGYNRMKLSIDNWWDFWFLLD